MFSKYWNVLPLAKNSKYPPLLKNWETTKIDQSTLNGHVGNFGLGCGMISEGMIAFDWDFRPGLKKEGFKVIFKEYSTQFPDLVDTLIASTPHGYHFYYVLKNKEISNTSVSNAGYSSKLKKFYNKHQTRFGKYLKGIDTRANQGYTVIPPSEVNGEKYEWKQKKRPIEITLDQYKEIRDFFDIDKNEQKIIRKKFVDILMGKLDPHELASEDHPEHVYWKELYHEIWSCCNLQPEELFQGLHKNQKAFDEEETVKQLNNDKNREYIFSETRMSKEKYNDYFGIENDSFEFMNSENNEKEDCLIIPYDNNMIHIFEDYMELSSVRRKKTYIEKFLDCSLSLIRKCFYKKEERFSYEMNGKEYHTSSILEIIERADPYLRKGQKGKDCLKEVISHYSKQMELTKSREFLGFDNGWVLPQTEKEKKESIIVITDYQQEAYDRAKLMIKEYSSEEKKEIKKKLQKFIQCTQCESINKALLIGWSLASPFRIFFIEKYDLFPILYNYGPPNTGRSSLEDFWIIDFYHIYDSHLPPNTSVARLEDHLSKSSFPHSLQDLKEENLFNNRELLGMLLDYSTSLGLFERKKGGKKIDFIKYKIAGLNLDSNDILSAFTSPNINERLIFAQYTKKTQLDLEWIKLREELKKYKLFSLVYEYTKDWTNNTVKERYEKILSRFTSEFKTNSSRLLKSAAILRFGLDLFSDVFGIQSKFTDQMLIDEIIKGSSKMTEGIVDQFREFCSVALNYNETTQTIEKTSGGFLYPQINKGENPRYLNHKLRKDTEEKFYIYTTNNHEDYKHRYGEKCGMKALSEKILKGLSEKESPYIEYLICRPFYENNIKCKPMGVIKIDPKFLSDSDEIDGKDMDL